MSDDTIYWAVKLDDASVGTLLSNYPPVHSKVYAEHMTIAFRPSDKVNERLMSDKGKEVMLVVAGHTLDNKGQAVVVTGYGRLDFGVPHITISCAEGVSPKYSNELISQDNIHMSGPGYPTLLRGKVARFTSKGWDYEVLEESLRTRDVGEAGDP